MATTRYTLWSNNTLVDEEARPRKPWVVLSTLAGLLLLIDLILSLTLPDPTEAPVQSLNDAPAMQRYLDHVVEDGADAWLLLGDSVLVGDSVRDVVPDWDEHRVIDYLRRLQGPNSTAVFHQAALNGMLPVDLLQLLRALDTIDPRAHVGVVIELNLRYFSEEYAFQEECTRLWLDDLAPGCYENGALNQGVWVQEDIATAAHWLRDSLPILRHRPAFPPLAPIADLVPLTLAPAPGGEGLSATEGQLATEVEMEVRMLEHFRSPVLWGEYAQERALVEVVRRLRHSGRRALFFTPPLHDSLIESVLTEERHGKVLARLDELVRGDDAKQIQLAHFDHPIFSEAMFKDIAHMLPAGNRLLALQLLQALSIPLAEAPSREDLIYPEGPNRAIVWNLTGDSNAGPPWMAAFNKPQGMTLAGPDCLVIADTGNHCLRALQRPFGTTRTIAGQPGVAGWKDAIGEEALLDRPASPCAVGEEIYFIDGGGERLRRLSQGLVLTVHASPGSPLGEAQAMSQLRCRGGVLYLLTDDSRILALDIRRGSSQIVVEGEAHGGIRAFEVTDEGRVFFADKGNRIWSGSLVEPLRDPRFHKLVFDNQAPGVFPEVGFFPFSFDDVRFAGIADMQYLPRYDALLVQDEYQPEQSLDMLDDLVHFRLLDLRRRHVLPWVVTLASGAYAAYNEAAGTYVSPFRQGSLAVDPKAASWYYLERSRSRLLELEDGLWAASKIGQTNDMVADSPHRNVFGDFAGPYVYFNYRPDRFIEDRALPFKRRGPYMGMLLGSSLIGTAELFPDYSLGRVLENELQRKLGLQAGVQFDLLVRASAGRRFDEAVEEFEHFVETGGRADALFIEALNVHKIPMDASLEDLFSRLAAAAERHDTLVVFLNFFPLGAMQVEGPTVTDPVRRDTLAAIRSHGFQLIDSSDMMLRDSLSVYPWNNPPYTRHHGSPWAMDTVAKEYAARLFPLLEEHFQDRAPAVFRTVDYEDVPQDALRVVFDWFEIEWSALDLPEVPERAVQRRFHKRQLDLLIDLTKVPGYDSSIGEAEARPIALALLLAELRENLGSRRAVSARVLLATFANYDEYGEGVQESAQVHYRLEVDAPALKAFINETLGIDPVEETPDTAGTITP